MFGLLKIACMMVGCLLWGILWSAAEDEEIALEEAIDEGEFMSRPISHEKLSERSMAVVYENGSITINDQDMAVIELNADEAYALLDTLYRHMDLLRQRKDEPPLEVPSLRLLTEQEVEALAERIEEMPAWARPQ